MEGVVQSWLRQAEAEAGLETEAKEVRTVVKGPLAAEELKGAEELGMVEAMAAEVAAREVLYYLTVSGQLAEALVASFYRLWAAALVLTRCRQPIQ